MPKKFQLVFQFESETLEDFDRLTALEEAIEAQFRTSNDTKLDGHDCGMGEFNIFLHTNEPQSEYVKFADFINEFIPGLPFRAAFRSFEDEEYTVLWPSSLKTFSVA